jgi:hypothetical protein
MFQDLSVEEYNVIYKAKSEAHSAEQTQFGLASPASSLPTLGDSMSDGGVVSVLGNLVWWRSLDSPPVSVTPLAGSGPVDVENRVFNFDQWLDVSIAQLGDASIPKEVLDHMQQFGGKLGFAKLT